MHLLGHWEKNELKSFLISPDQNVTILSLKYHSIFNMDKMDKIQLLIINKMTRFL